jgi:hypothetical protein
VTGIVIEEFRRVTKGTLRGFARARFPSGLIHSDIGIHVAAETGRAWAMPPGRPMIENDTVMRREDGKIRHATLISFASTKIRNQWSDQVVAAVRAMLPEALR